MSINEIIRKLRHEREMTQNDLANLLNCNRQKIADLERGKSCPSVDDLILLCKIFNVSADYLLGLSDVKSVDKDIEFICDYTGLSENVIKILNQDNKNNYSSTINLLLEFRTKEQDDELSILDLISQYINITFIEFVKRHHIEELIGTPKFKELENMMNQAFLDEITTSLKELKINNKAGENSGNHTKEE